MSDLTAAASSPVRSRLARLRWRLRFFWLMHKRRIPFTIRTWKQLDASDSYWSRISWQLQCEASDAREKARIAIEQRDALVDALAEARTALFARDAKGG